MVGRFLETLFAWPDGIVVGNLIASALWAIPAFTHLHLKLRRQHRELQEGHPPAKSGKLPTINYPT